MPETTYRFGAIAFTLAAIRETGYRHGRDGIGCYLPRHWGRADRITDADRGPLALITPLEESYLAGFVAGRAAWAVARARFEPCTDRGYW